MLSSIKSFSKILLILFVPALLVLQACLERIEFPPEPIITFNGFAKIDDGSGADNRGVIEISYQDGDGDIGLTQMDTVPPYDYNLIIRYFEKKNGQFEEVFLTYYNSETQEYDTINLNARIPLLTPTGKNKSIKGIIQDTIYINNYSSPYDTVRFEVYILDRALHQSNTVSTPQIVINK
jgi:hypothetical protein